MQCPWCGKEMEDGTLRSRGGNYFLPSGEKASKIAFYTEKYLEKARAIPLPPDPYEWTFTEWPAARCCRSCRKLVIDF